MKVKQTERILNHMQEHGSITPLDAMNEYGIFRLASRISDLKKQGYDIQSSFIEVQNRYGEKCHVKSYSIGE